ncbi:hypothetical protein [Streptomyces sp. NPDC088725]|uniref:hypothetical protein n=1 Tax=Streptomyces sp. NPDC088725 TaxID=3365873 RepID=UPI0037FB0600
MSEHDQPTAGGGIDYTSIVRGTEGTGPTMPGMFDSAPGAVRVPGRVDFGIDSLGQWHIEVRAHDGQLLEVTDDGMGNQPIDLAAYPTDNPAGAVDLHAELTRRFPDSQVVWRPGVMNSLDEASAAAHRALAAAAKDRKAARAAADTAGASLRKALPLAVKARLGPAEIATRTGYARSTITSALTDLIPAQDNTR